MTFPAVPSAVLLDAGGVFVLPESLPVVTCPPRFLNSLTNAIQRRNISAHFVSSVVVQSNVLPCRPARGVQ